MLLKDIKIVEKGVVNETIFVDTDTAAAVSVYQLEAERVIKDGIPGYMFPYTRIKPNGDITTPKLDNSIIDNNQNDKLYLGEENSVFKGFAINGVMGFCDNYVTEIKKAYLDTGFPCLSCVAMLKDRNTSAEYVWVKIISKSTKKLHDFLQIISTELPVIDGVSSIKGMSPVQKVLNRPYCYCNRILLSRKLLEYMVTPEWRRLQAEKGYKNCYWIADTRNLKNFDYCKTKKVKERVKKSSITAFSAEMSKQARAILKSVIKKREELS